MAFMLLLFSTLATATPQFSGFPYPYCTDGGQLRCCAATFNGDNAPVELLTSLSCYDLTPATINCILTGASPDPNTGVCAGSYQCCQIVLDPIIGLYCGPPPGPCQGPEASPRCLDVLGGRFGICPATSPLAGLLDVDGYYLPGSGRFIASLFSGPGAGGGDPVTGLNLGGLLPGLSGLLGGRDIDADGQAGEGMEGRRDQ